MGGCGGVTPVGCVEEWDIWRSDTSGGLPLCAE